MHFRLGFFVVLLALTSSCTTLTEKKYDFGPWAAGTSPQEVGKRVVDNFLPRAHMTISPDRAIHYAETCTWYGGLTFAELSGDKDRTAKLVARFDPLFGPDAKLIPRAVNVDNTVFGAVPLELFIEKKDARYLKIGKDLADQQWEPPAGDLTTQSQQMRDNLAAGLSRHTRFWVDDMYMITILQVQAFRATGDKKYLDRAAREAVAYLDKLQQPNGLFYHATNAPFFGRAATAGSRPACRSC